MLLEAGMDSDLRASTGHHCDEVVECREIHQRSHDIPLPLAAHFRLNGIRLLYSLDLTRPRCPTRSSGPFVYSREAAWPETRTTADVGTTRRTVQERVTMWVGSSCGIGLGGIDIEDADSFPRYSNKLIPSTGLLLSSFFC